MKKLFFLAACVSLMAASCTGNKSNDDNSAAAERDSLQRIIDNKDQELNEIMGTFNEIQDGFRRINEAEGRIAVADGNLESASNKEAIRENMEFIQSTMAQNRDMIAKLKDKLRTSSINADKLKETIDKLTQDLEAQKQRIQELEIQLAEKDIVIAQQDEAINSLNNDVENLAAENTSKSQTVAAQDKQLNTAWFVFGTKSELKEQKILQNGDVLKSGNFNKDYFTKIDIRYDKIIKLYSKSAKLLTNHPDGSYKLIKDTKGQYMVEITNPTEFWSVSKYLVIQVR